jgi:AcrR family transcriptional regulator
VRYALGEFDDAPIMAGHTLGACLAGRLEFRRGGNADQPGIHAKMADDAEALAGLALSEAVALEPAPHPQHVPPTPPAPDLTTVDSRTALILAATEMLAAKGPASLTTRKIAGRAQVNQGLSYHYFDSQEHLFAEAMALANQPLQAVTMPGVPLDLVVATRARLSTLSLPLMARLIVNGIPVASVRKEFPVVERLVTEARHHANQRDARLVAFATGAFATGLALWDDLLRRMVGLSPDDDLLTPIAAMTDYLLRHQW